MERRLSEQADELQERESLRQEVQAMQQALQQAMRDKEEALALVARREAETQDWVLVQGQAILRALALASDQLALRAEALEAQARLQANDQEILSAQTQAWVQVHDQFTQRPAWLQ